jgi:integrase
MKPSGTIIKRKSGRKVTWWARIRYVDEHGKQKDLQRRADSKSHAGDLMREKLREIEKTHGRSVRAEQMTFSDLCAHMEKHYIVEAEYVDGRKVRGLRSLVTAQAQLNMLRDYFGYRKLRSITYADLMTFKATRLKTETRYGTQRSIATVNRELAAVRRMFNVALREGWILRTPFTSGDSLISIADERKRERIITREEEQKLLEACDAPRRQHLKPILICALDTGMRQGEIFSLRWRDVDFVNGVLNIQAFNTKTMRARQVAMTTRLQLELERLRETAPDRPNTLVFGVIDNVQTSFERARADAGINGLRFHDLRHTAATRLAGAHIPLSEVGRVLGHSQPSTTYRYINSNIDTARRAAAALNTFNSEIVAHEAVEAVN